MGEEEDLDHIFRHCSRAKGIWDAFLPKRENDRLRSMSFAEWLSTNIKDVVTPSRERCWRTTFTIMVWWIWRWRNDVVFSGKEVDMRHKLCFIENQEEDISRAFKRTKGASRDMQVKLRSHKWEPPPPNWVVINTDACFSSENDLAGCGGVLRNSMGDWIAGFSCAIRAGNSAEAECWVILKAFHWAWTIGYKKVWIQSDAKEVANWIMTPVDLCGPIHNGLKLARTGCAKIGTLRYLMSSENRTRWLMPLLRLLEGGSAIGWSLNHLQRRSRRLFSRIGLVRIHQRGPHDRC